MPKLNPSQALYRAWTDAAKKYSLDPDGLLPPNNHQAMQEIGSTIGSTPEEFREVLNSMIHDLCCDGD